MSISRTSTTTTSRGGRARRRAAVTIFALLTAVATALLSPGVAFAANGGNPYTQCSNPVVGKSVAITDGGRQIGTVELRFADNCNGEWTRANYASGYTAYPSVWMQNQDGTNLYTVYSDSTQAYTYMLSNMKYQVGCGGAQVYAGSRYVGWFYAGCY